jgi:hypothetical protein
MAQQHDDSWREMNVAGGNGAAGADAITSFGAGDRKSFSADGRWKDQDRRGGAAGGRPREKDGAGAAARAAAGADRWAEEQLFEEDVRSVLMMMRPNRRERLLGWSEYRTGGAHFRVTVSWDEEFEVADAGRSGTRIPNMADVLEAILVGSARHDDDLMPAEEFEIYRSAVRELYRRLDDLQSCYE